MTPPGEVVELPSSFSVEGRLPGAFRHRELGYVDAFVIFTRLAI
jgi:hypothetical protein